MPDHSTDVAIIVGVDTHKDIHVAVAIDTLGRRQSELAVPATAAGYQQLHRWALDLGPNQAFGVEGTGSYGAGLARYLHNRGAHVIEVNRPDRATRHRLGKSDPIDAEAAARAVLAGTATGTPKHGDDYVEMIRILKLTRDAAVKSQTQATNQVKAVLVTAPPQLREALQHLPRIALLQRCAALRAGELTTPLAASKHALRLLARRALALRAEAKALRAQLTALTTAACPALVELTSIGPDSAAALLISAGDNPNGYAAKPPSPHSAAPTRSQPPPAKPPATGSTAAAIAKPTPPSTAPSSPECTGTNPPSPTSSGGPPKARRSPRSCAASCATSPARSTAASSLQLSARRRPHPTKRTWNGPLDKNRSICPYSRPGLKP
jgi:transposase